MSVHRQTTSRGAQRLDRRTELARATLRVTAAIGYEAATVAEIAEEAGVSRRAFNRHFHDKDAAFEVGYREITRDLRRTVQAAYDAADTPIRRTWSCLEALADFLASDPRRAELLVIHGHAAGQGTAQVHCETMSRLVDLILANTAELPQPTGDARLVAETVAGGIYEIVFARVLRGQVRSLPGLVPDWARVVMAPYVAIATADEA
ncbi:MAG: TetR/AcrR family transcriptional regulator [Patulibacter sp.]